MAGATFQAAVRLRRQGRPIAIWRIRNVDAKGAASGASARAADIVLGSRRIVQPDVFVVPLVGGRRPRSWEEAGSLLLAVEVLSPSTARTDRVLKRRVYQDEGVPEYWLIDLDTRVFLRWRPGAAQPEELGDVIQWQAPGAPAAIGIEIPAFFERRTERPQSGNALTRPSPPAASRSPREARAARAPRRQDRTAARAARPTRCRLTGWRPTDDRPEIVVDALTWSPEGAREPLAIDLRPIFDAVAEDEV